MMFLSILAGLVILTIGGEALVRGSVAIAARLNVPKLVIGLTLVGFGTSAPELVTSLQAALAGSPGIAIGNVVGSNICNILLILGLASIIMPMAAPWADLKRDHMAMMGASLVLLGLCIEGEITRLAGAILFLGLIAYLAVTFYMARKNAKIVADIVHEDDIPESPVHNLPLNILLTLAGLALLVFGARLLVNGSIELAQFFNVPDTIIGLTIVAVGTSLPELVTSVMAAIKRHADVAIGNILGSNIFNILSILGITALVHPIEIPASILTLDIWVMLGAAAFLVALSRFKHGLGRIAGTCMLVAYGAYVTYLIGTV